MAIRKQPVRRRRPSYHLFIRLVSLVSIIFNFSFVIQKMGELQNNYFVNIMIQPSVARELDEQQQPQPQPQPQNKIIMIKQQHKKMVMHLPDLPLQVEFQKLLYPTPSGQLCTFRDKVSNLVLQSATKAGCMQSMMLLYNHLGVMQDALATNPKDSFNALNVYWNKNASLLPRIDKKWKYKTCAGTCERADWTCIKVIRNPLDRTVSSYVHTVSRNVWRGFEELHVVTNRSSTNSSAREATFEQFVDGLELRAMEPKRTTSDNHFLPQKTSDGCDETMDYLIPLEATDVGLELIAFQTNISLSHKDIFSSSHYISGGKDVSSRKKQSKAENATVEVNASQISPISNNKLNKSRVFNYENYYHNPKVNTKVCRLFYMDFQLYAKSCQQTIDKIQKVVMEEEKSTLSAAASLRNSNMKSPQQSFGSLLQQVQEECETGWQRIDNVCGETFQTLIGGGGGV